MYSTDLADRAISFVAPSRDFFDASVVEH